jgi:hypothetical protein
MPTSASGYALDPNAYLNPEAAYMQSWADKGLQSAYAGAGDLLSGPAMQGIANYDMNAAANNAYAPAMAAAQQQQGTAIGLDQYNQQFGYSQALNNQTIPFNQQMQVAQLGLQGTQGAQSVQNLLATLLSQNALGAGQASAAGTQGSASSISAAIQAAMNNYLQQSLLNRIPGLNQPATTG